MLCNLIQYYSIKFQVKFPIRLNDKNMELFLITLCEACEACPNLITLEPVPDQCENCKQADEQDEQDAQKATEERAKAVKRPNLDKEKHHHNSKSFKSSPPNDKSNVNAINFSIKNVNIQMFPTLFFQINRQTFTVVQIKEGMHRHRRCQRDRQTIGVLKKLYNLLLLPIQP